MTFPKILWEIFWCAFHSSLMCTVAMVTLKSKVTFAVLNISIYWSFQTLQCKFSNSKHLRKTADMSLTIIRNKLWDKSRSTLIRMFGNLRGVLQDIYSWNVLTTSIYVRNNRLRLFYEGFFETNGKFLIFILLPWQQGRKDQTAKMVVFITFWTIFLEKEVFSSNL